jgi:hypothetical protein
MFNVDSSKAFAYTAEIEKASITDALDRIS